MGSSPKVSVWSLCCPEEFELDLSNFSLSENTKTFFEQIAGLLRCKLALDSKYQEVRSELNVLQSPKYDSFGERPMQERAKFMTIENVFNDAQQKKHAFEGLLESTVIELGLNPEEEIVVSGETIQNEWGPYKVLTVPPLKSKERSQAKTNDDQKGSAKRLCDVGRATIVCRTEDQVVQVIEKLKKRDECDIVRMKNRVSHPTYTGMRDILMNIKVDGHVFELQIHLADLLAIDLSDGHHFYEYFREYFVGTSEFLEKQAEILQNFGKVILDTDNISEAIRDILKGEDIDKLKALQQITNSKIFGVHELSLKVMKRLVSLLLEKGAEEKALLNEFKSMAVLYCDQGEYKKALEWYQRTLIGREAALGKKHPDTLHIINNMAMVYKKQGKYEKALEWYHRALGEREGALGREYPNTLKIINNMALVYFRKGEYKKAEAWFQEAHKGIEAVHGKEHPDTLDTVNNMAVMYSKQGEYEKAQEWYRRALDGFEAAFGKKHPRTLRAIHNMGVVYLLSGEYNKALEWFQRSLKGKEVVHGKGHPSTRRTISNMALCLRNKKRRSSAHPNDLNEDKYIPEEYRIKCE